MTARQHCTINFICANSHLIAKKESIISTFKNKLVILIFYLLVLVYLPTLLLDEFSIETLGAKD